MGARLSLFSSREVDVRKHCAAKVQVSDNQVVLYGLKRNPRGETNSLSLEVSKIIHDFLE